MGKELHARHQLSDLMKRFGITCSWRIGIVNKRPFLVSAFLGTEYVMVNRIKSRSSKDICPDDILKKPMSEMNRLGFRVTTIRVDGESGAGADEETTS